MTRVAAVRAEVPGHQYTQAELTEAFAGWCGVDGAERALLERFHAACGVRTRHLAAPLEAYERLGGFGGANDLFIATALDLGERAVAGALADAGLTPGDVDLIIATSVTGIAAPSIDARLVDRLGLRSDVKRIPIFGLGCVAGAAGIARLHDYLRAWPEQVAVLLSVELCSLTVQPSDTSVPNLLASGLFGDGAAAVVAVGADRAQRTARRHPSQQAANQQAAAPTGPDVLASRSRFYPGTERVMGWDIGGSGFRIVLAASVADVVRAHLGADVEAFLADQGFTLDEVGSWVCHPGGPKVIDAITDVLRLSPRELDLTRRSLAQVGNLSSASVLHVLADTMAYRRPPPGSLGMLLAMGPGFCAELVTLRW